MPGLYRDLIATIEEYERVILGVVDGFGIRIDDFVRQHRARLRGIAERARAGEHVGKGVAAGLDLEMLLRARSDGNVQIIRISCDPLDWAFLAPEVTADYPHSRAVIVGDLRNGVRWDVLIARVGHFQRRWQVGP